MIAFTMTTKDGEQYEAAWDSSIDELFKVFFNGIVLNVDGADKTFKDDSIARITIVNKDVKICRFPTESK